MTPKPPPAGHNSGISAERLKSFVKRIEKLNEDKQAIADDIKEVYSECKSAGYDVPTVRKLIALRKIELDKRREAGELLGLYASALQMELF